MTQKNKTARRVQPENWADIHAYAKALERFAATRDPNEFSEFHISHEAMAKALVAIAYGADARDVFRQTGAAPRRPSLRLFNRTRAFAYWKARIDGASPREAIRAAQDHFPDLPSISDATVTRLANRYQKEALRRFESAGMDISAVRGQIEARSKQGSWDR